MKTSRIFKYLLSLSLIETFFITNSSIAFFPRINEPNKQELEYTSIQIGETAKKLIQFGQYKEAIKIRLSKYLNIFEVFIIISKYSLILNLYSYATSMA